MVEKYNEMYSNQCSEKKGNFFLQIRTNVGRFNVLKIFFTEFINYKIYKIGMTVNTDFFLCSYRTQKTELRYSGVDHDLLHGRADTFKSPW